MTAAAALALAACGVGPGAPTTTIGDPPTTTTTSSGSDLTTTTTTVLTTTSTTPEPAEALSEDLLVVGDWGWGTLPQGAVAGAMMRYSEDNEVEAILTTGDNFYSDDTEFLMEPFGWAVDSDIPFWIAWGDHDIETETRVEAIEDTFGDPPRWASHEWGRVDVIILDSTQVDSEEQTEFLASEMESSDGPAIVVFHHPVLSCGVFGDSEVIADTWVQLFDDDVVLVINGHEHNYQRFEDSGISYLVTGGGGAPLTELSDCPSGHPEMLAGESIHHFVVLEQDDDLSISVVDVNGGVIDEVEVDLP